MKDIIEKYCERLNNLPTGKLDEDSYNYFVTIFDIINETWNVALNIEEQVKIYDHKFKVLNKRLNSLKTKLNETNRKLDLVMDKLNIEEPLEPTPREISYWANFGHFPDKESK